MTLEELTDIFFNLSTWSQERGNFFDYEILLKGVNKNAITHTAQYIAFPSQDELNAIQHGETQHGNESIGHFNLKLCAAWYIKKTHKKDVFIEHNYRGNRPDIISKDYQIIMGIQIQKGDRFS